MNLLKHWLVLAALAAAPLLRGGDENIGVSALPAPDTGTVSELPAIWKGGEGRPSTVTLTIRIPGGEPLSEIALKSRSINRWWAISGVTLEGVRDGKTVKLAAKPWFVRGEDDTPKVFAIKLNPGAEGFSEYRLSLRRPHGFLHMELSELNVVFAGRLQAEIRPERTLFRAGGTVSGTVKLNNPFPSPGFRQTEAVRGRNLRMGERTGRSARRKRKRLVVPGGQAGNVPPDSALRIGCETGGALHG